MTDVVFLPSAELVFDSPDPFGLFDTISDSIKSAVSEMGDIPIRFASAADPCVVTIVNGEVRAEGCCLSDAAWDMGGVGDGSDQEVVAAVSRCAKETVKTVMSLGSGRLVIRDALKGQWTVKKGRLYAVVRIRAGWEPIAKAETTEQAA